MTNNKIKNKTGYWLLDELVVIVENELFKNITLDETRVQWMVKDLNALTFLIHYENRASLLSFISDFPTLESREAAIKAVIKKTSWNQLKGSFQKFQYTPSMLYIYLKKIKIAPGLVDKLIESVSNRILSFDNLKGASLKNRQDYWQNSIILFD